MIDLSDLRQGAKRLVVMTAADRQELLLACVAGIESCWQRWVEAACKAKRIPVGDAARAEDIMTGPLPTLRYLWLLHRTLDEIANHGEPQLPAASYEARGHLRVPVFPTRSLFDRLMFGPIKAEVRMPADKHHQQGKDGGGLFGDCVKRATGRLDEPPVVTLILGAGNVSSIPITDALTKIFQDNQAVVLKLNPVNDYLGPLFEEAFASLISADLLRIVYGGADIGKSLISADEIDRVHITGSDRTHDAIVWGSSPEEQAERKAADTPILNKPITSELGNVSPWIIVPGNYSKRQLRFQAENIVASVTSNVSFNCIATKMLITHKDWPQRDQFLDLIDDVLAQVPRRFPYYPGAADRYARFAGEQDTNRDDSESLPWRFRRGVDIETDPHLFREESFVCVFGETQIQAATPTEFINSAVDFANDRMWGTLSAALTVPQDYQKHFAKELDEAIDRLKYGVVGINQWPGVAFALMSTPWGAFPGTTLLDIQSGVGSVHNTYLLDEPEQTVISSPLTIFPKPMWFSTHRRPELVARSLIRLYVRPSIRRVPLVLYNAILG